MPKRKSRTIATLDKSDFHWMKKHAITQLEKAKSAILGLKDFAILVTDPEWGSLKGR
jgi:hypothetical protein